jgi:hypothetical protein
MHAQFDALAQQKHLSVKQREQVRASQHKRFGKRCRYGGSHCRAALTLCCYCSFWGLGRRCFLCACVFVLLLLFLLVCSCSSTNVMPS